jgi:hypothetical protein
MALGDFGIVVSPNTVARLLHQMGYSLRVNHKQIPTDFSPDRNRPFAHDGQRNHPAKDASSLLVGGSDTVKDLKLFILSCLLTVLLPAQTAESFGSVAGSVRHAGTGDPVVLFNMSLCDDPTGGCQVGRATSGAYSFDKVAPGTYRLSADFGTNKNVTVVAGERSVVDFTVPAPSFASITGRVLDDDGHPVAKASVRLIAKVYRSGALQSVIVGRAETDSLGVYRFEALPAGAPMIVRVDGSTEGRESPADTFFPHAISQNAAQEIVLASGEKREAIDVHQINRPSYCIDGVAETVPGFDAMVAMVNRAEARSESMINKQLSAIGKMPGNFVICGLHSGRYRIAVRTSITKIGAFAEAYSLGTVNVIGGDIHGLRLKSQSPIELSAETIWKGEPSPPASRAKVIVHMQGTQLMGGFHAVEQAVPNRVSISPNLTHEDYEIDRVAVVDGADAYIEDVTWNGAPLPASRIVSLGAEVASGHFRIVVSDGGASVTFRVFDKSGDAAPNANIAIIPASAGSEAEMYSTMIFAQTDQNGLYSARAVKPGNYQVLAVAEPVDGARGIFYDDRAPALDANFAARLWSAKSDGKVLNLSKNDTIEFSLQLRPLP